MSNALGTVTLRDVAELAAVSLATASQALNNRPNISVETRHRVLDAAVKLGYKRREYRTQFTESAAPQVATSQTLRIAGALVKHDIGSYFIPNPFYSHIQFGLEGELRKHDIAMMFSHVQVDASNRPKEVPAMIAQGHVDGLVLLGTFLDGTVDVLAQEAGVPVVLIDGYAPNLPHDSVQIDNLGGARQAITHLRELGHVCIGLLGSNPQSPPSVLERRQGFSRAADQLGVDCAWVEDSSLSQNGGYESARALLQRESTVTALFACNDEVALGALDAVREFGLRVPEDISVVGFDDIDAARTTRPGLTTVRVPKSWLGIAGARLLMERAREPNMPRRTVSLSTELVIRGSTAPARARGG
jgi:DNA-binding LacI/PurR family transcriptional regulator